MNSTLFGTKMQMTILKSLPNAIEAAKFLENLKNDKDVFSGEIKPEMIQLFNISSENVPMFFKKQRPVSYELFYQDNYKTIINSVKQKSP